MGPLIARCASPLLDLLYPAQCALCGTIGESAWCPVCHSETAWLEPSPVTLVQPDPLTRYVAAAKYTGRAAQAVTRLKYGRHTALGPPMARAIARLVEACGLDDSDHIVPVPIHPIRWCQRGFNQATLLAEGLPKELFQPDLLRRVRFTRPQASLPIERRERNLIGAFTCTEDLSGARVLLVDDVLTSGTTLRECATALKERGAKSVSALVFAVGHTQ